MTKERQALIDRFQKWLDTKPIEQIIAAQCATIAEEYAEQLLIQRVSGSALPNDNKEHYDCLIECCNNLLDAVEAGKKPMKQIMGLKILLHR